jgi:hypoxanthine phosphoribosyltransferase
MGKKNKFLYISWNDLHDLCFKLSKKIEKKDLGVDRIVAITRGGLPVARIFSDFLKLPVSLFTISAYVGVNSKKKAKITEKLVADIGDKKVLLLDEVVDTGDTFKVALKYLQKLGPKKIHTCTPCIKTWVKDKPDFCQVETDKWIIFPYEIRETVEELKKNMSLPEIKKLGLPPKQVNYFFQK